MMGSSCQPRHRILIVGGGFGGVYAARNLGGDPRLDVTIVDRRNFHLFQPLLFQVATGVLGPSDIIQPLRSMFGQRENTTVLLGEAVALDPRRREVRLSDGGRLGYDSLVVATGAGTSYFGHDDWAGHAPGLKSLDGATEIRRRVLIAFEAAEREADADRRAEWLTFVVVGGGPTGVELAGALGEIANDTLRREFRSIDPALARVNLVEASDRVLPLYPADASLQAVRQLQRKGVIVRTGTKVVHVDGSSVGLAIGTRQERLPARTVLWAAGAQVSSFARAVALATRAETDRSGRLIVGPDLTIPGYPEIFAVGGAAVQPWRPGAPVPDVAQGGIQGGTYAAKAIQRRLFNRPVRPFRYSNHGDVAVIGRMAAVTDIPWLGPVGRRSGAVAWLLWLAIHIYYLGGFTNRIVVAARWTGSFLTQRRGSRLIAGRPHLPPIKHARDHGAGDDDAVTRAVGPPVAGHVERHQGLEAL